MKQIREIRWIPTANGMESAYERTQADPWQKLSLKMSNLSSNLEDAWNELIIPIEGVRLFVTSTLKHLQPRRPDPRFVSPIYNDPEFRWSFNHSPRSMHVRLNENLCTNVRNKFRENFPTESKMISDKGNGGKTGLYLQSKFASALSVASSHAHTSHHIKHRANTNRQMTNMNNEKYDWQSVHYMRNNNYLTYVLFILR